MGGNFKLCSHLSITCIICIQSQSQLNRKDLWIGRLVAFYIALLDVFCDLGDSILLKKSFSWCMNTSLFSSWLFEQAWVCISLRGSKFVVNVTTSIKLCLSHWRCNCGLNAKILKTWIFSLSNNWNQHGIVNFSDQLKFWSVWIHICIYEWIIYTYIYILQILLKNVTLWHD